MPTMPHGETREKIGKRICELMCAGYSVDIHLNRITNQYRVTCTHHAQDFDFCVRDASLLSALSRACAGEMDP